jgi:DNA-binding LytR/AlgR family response regulator
MKLKCLLVDDEPPALDVLRTYIASTPALEVVGECHHAMEAFDFLQHHEVDLIFLDIQMPQLQGTAFVRTLPNPPKVIFTTAHREYALEGFDLNAVDYLLKPIPFDRFLKAVHKALHTEQKPFTIKPDTSTVENERFLYFRADRKMVKVMMKEIRYIESLKDYVKVFDQTAPIITKQTITAVEEMLPADDFIRVHRSFIVALDKITSFSPHAVFIGKEEIPIGPLYRDKVVKRLSNGFR